MSSCGSPTGSGGKESALTRMTAASEPGLIAVPARTMWSYWRYTQFLEAIDGQPSSLARPPPAWPSRECQ